MRNEKEKGERKKRKEIEKNQREYEIRE